MVHRRVSSQLFNICSLISHSTPFFFAKDFTKFCCSILSAVRMGCRTLLNESSALWLLPLEGSLRHTDKKMFGRLLVDATVTQLLICSADLIATCILIEHVPIIASTVACGSTARSCPKWLYSWRNPSPYVTMQCVSSTTINTLRDDHTLLLYIVHIPSESNSSGCPTTYQYYSSRRQ